MGFFGSGKKKILIADDDASVREMLGDLFSEDYEVFLGEDGDQAISLALDNSPNLILLDYNMPGKSGLEVVRHLRSRDQTKETPIIMVTAQDSLNAVEVLLKAGATDYVVKPFDLGNIKKKVESLLA